MINGLVDDLKSINNITYNNNLAKIVLNYTRNFVLTLVEIEHRLNQLYNGLRKLKSYVSPVYSYTDSIGSKIVTPTLTDPVFLTTILNNM